MNLADQMKQKASKVQNIVQEEEGLLSRIEEAANNGKYSKNFSIPKNVSSVRSMLVALGFNVEFNKHRLTMIVSWR